MVLKMDKKTIKEVLQDDNLTAFNVIDSQIGFVERVVNNIILSKDLLTYDKYRKLLELYISSVKVKGLNEFSYLSLLKGAVLLNQLRVLSKYEIEKSAELYKRVLYYIKENEYGSLSLTFETLKALSKLRCGLENIENVVDEIVFDKDKKLTYELKYFELKKLYLMDELFENKNKPDFFYIVKRVKITRHLRFLAKCNKDAKKLYEALMNDKEVLDTIKFKDWY